MVGQFADKVGQNPSTTPTRTTSTTATPRGRGRPKGALNKSTIAAQIDSENVATDNTPTTTPRGRGRPKGALNKSTIAAQIDSENAATDNIPTTTPRGRGRPKGSLNKFKKQSLSNVPADILTTIPSFTILMGEPDDEINMPRKHSRGRPKAEFDEAYNMPHI